MAIMAFITFKEIIDIIIMSLAVGFIFKDMFKTPRTNYDPLEYYGTGNYGAGKRRKTKNAGVLAGTKFIKYFESFFSQDFRFAVLVTAPAIILHELGHKITAMSFGYMATFNAAYTWLGIGILLKLLNSGFIFFVPAYVSISGAVQPIQHSMIAFAGPAINLILFLIALILLKNKSFMAKHKNWVLALFLMKRINLFMFVFNMLPIPMFDGYSVYSGLWHYIGSL